MMPVRRRPRLPVPGSNLRSVRNVGRHPLDCWTDQTGLVSRCCFCVDAARHAEPRVKVKPAGRWIRHVRRIHSPMGDQGALRRSLRNGWSALWLRGGRSGGQPDHLADSGWGSASGDADRGQVAGDRDLAGQSQRSGQETAAFTSATTLFSTCGLHFTSAKDAGHMSPSSRFAASWKPSVE